MMHMPRPTEQKKAHIVENATKRMYICQAGFSCALEGLEFAGFHSLRRCCCAVGCVGNKAKWSGNGKPENDLSKRMPPPLWHHTLGGFTTFRFYVNQNKKGELELGILPACPPHLTQTHSEEMYLSPGISCLKVRWHLSAEEEMGWKRHTYTLSVECSIMLWQHNKSQAHTIPQLKYRCILYGSAGWSFYNISMRHNYCLVVRLT